MIRGILLSASVITRVATDAEQQPSCCIAFSKACNPGAEMPSSFVRRTCMGLREIKNDFAAA